MCDPHPPLETSCGRSLGRERLLIFLGYLCASCGDPAEAAIVECFTEIGGDKGCLRLTFKNYLDP